MCVLAWHCGVDVKNFGWTASVFAGLALVASTAALALEEQVVPVGPPAASEDAAKAGVQDAAPVAKPESGTEIRIPGLGKLGTLPKMDFGLELLYGAADGKPVEDPVPENLEQQDLTIRGSVKHRF